MKVLCVLRTRTLDRFGITNIWRDSLMIDVPCSDDIVCEIAVKLEARSIRSYHGQRHVDFDLVSYLPENGQPRFDERQARRGADGWDGTATVH